MGIVDPTYVQVDPGNVTSDSSAREKSSSFAPAGWLVLTFSDPAEAAKAQQEILEEERATGRIVHKMVELKP